MIWQWPDRLNSELSVSFQKPTQCECLVFTVLVRILYYFSVSKTWISEEGQFHRALNRVQYLLLRQFSIATFCFDTMLKIARILLWIILKITFLWYKFHIKISTKHSVRNIANHITFLTLYLYLHILSNFFPQTVLKLNLKYTQIKRVKWVIITMSFKLRRAKDRWHVSDIKNACYQPDNLSFTPCTYIMGKESHLLEFSSSPHVQNLTCIYTSYETYYKDIQYLYRQNLHWVNLLNGKSFLQHRRLSGVENFMLTVW